MNNFFKTFLAALLAFVVGNIVIGLISVIIIASFVAMFSTTETVSVKPQSVLKIDFEESIVDSPRSSLSSLSSSLMTGQFGMSKSLSMLQVLTTLENAAADDNIKGIYINNSGSGSVEGMAQMEELRAALEKFKQSGKFIVSYSDSYSQGLYWIASVADKVYLQPEGSFSWVGLSSQVMFYKGLIDKLGVDVEVFRHGTYKSAVEPYISDRMSPANRLQTQTMIDSIWEVLLDNVSASRGIGVDTLNLYADQLTVSSPAAALECGFIDDILYEDQVNDILASMASGELSDTVQIEAGAKQPEIISLGQYASQSSLNGKKVSKNKVAIIYADGQIIDGKSDGSSIGGQTIAAKIAAARQDERVKAVVLRVNSPGGSAMASDVIWREMELLREQKPVVVSMSNYAASGGYYISCPADAIMADRTTLTGSIGVFGLKMNAGEALKNKVGITVDGVKTNTSSDMASIFRSLTPDENAFMMQQIESVYTTFVDHVANGRNMTFEEVDAIGQGRVWSGVDASQIGLIDGFGTLSDAVLLAADRAGVVDNFRIVESLEADDPLLSLLMGVSSSVRTARLQNELGEGFKYYNTVMKMAEKSGVQALMPYFVEIQ